MSILSSERGRRRSPLAPAAFLAGVLAMAMVAGCGGGGTPAAPVPAPVQPPLSSRTITGTVVSSANTSKGVQGVTISFSGVGSATTDSKGQFQLSAGYSGATLPYYFQVDTSGAGAIYPRSSNQIVTLNGQTYNWEEVYAPIAVLNEVTGSLGTIMVNEASGDAPPPVPYASNDTILVGRVVSKKDGTGIENVTVSFGQAKVVTAQTGKKGYFGLNLGRDEGVLTYYPATSGTFSINTATAVGSFPSTLQVSFNDQTFLQNSIEVPVLQLLNSRAIGTVKVIDDGSGTDVPPPPPLPPGF